MSSSEDYWYWNFREHWKKLEIPRSLLYYHWLICWGKILIIISKPPKYYYFKIYSCGRGANESTNWCRRRRYVNPTASKFWGRSGQRWWSRGSHDLFWLWLFTKKIRHKIWQKRLFMETNIELPPQKPKTKRHRSTFGGPG